VLTLITLVAAIAAQRRPRALTIGRVALGIYYVFAGALVHLLYLVRGDTYASFAEAAHFSFVRNAWRAVVAPPISVLHRAAGGLRGHDGAARSQWRRRAEIGMIGILGMQAGLLLFGWVITVSAAVILIAVGFLLGAQRHHDMQIVQSVPEPSATAARLRG
jgi:hypothetical protein